MEIEVMLRGIMRHHEEPVKSPWLPGAATALAIISCYFRRSCVLRGGMVEWVFQHGSSQATSANKAR